MAPVPPPPPPAPPPPPPPMNGPLTAPPKLGKSAASDRNALLSDIRLGAKLKKAVVVNDRSSPMIDGKSSSQSSSSTGNGTTRTVSSSKQMSNTPMQLGELFAGGVPKLRPTGNKYAPKGAPQTTVNATTRADETRAYGGSKGNITNVPKNTLPVASSTTSALKSSLEEKLQLNTNNSNNNNSFLHAKAMNMGDNGFITNKNKYHTINLSRTKERPNNYSMETTKAHAPPVPTDVNGGAPSLPKKPPKGIQRSNSQVSGTRNVRTVRPAPPSSKPPPPPKLPNSTVMSSNTAPQFPLPSKPPPNVDRHQSFANIDVRSRHENWSGKSDAPPPPIAGALNALLGQGFQPKNPSNGFTNQNQSPNYPPPPPPISTMPTSKPINSNGSSTIRFPNAHKPAPVAPVAPIQNTRVQSQSPRPPHGPPPPPPPHRTTSASSTGSSLYPAAPPPPPPSQMKVMPSSMSNRNEHQTHAPLPPTRHTSIAKDDFSRFTFKQLCQLPVPNTFSRCNKVYPSHLQQSQRRRDPPPPPPPQQSHGASNNNLSYNAHSNNPRKFSSSNPMLHIQIGSSVGQC